jgi:hypothetical protein
MGRGCTSTLVHPRLTTTAAHCVQDMQTDGIANVGESAPFVRTVQRQLCRRPRSTRTPTRPAVRHRVLHPQGGDQRRPHRARALGVRGRAGDQAGNAVIIAGFGAPNNGRKYWGNVTVTQLRNGAEVLMRGEGVLGRAGDSGGPGYIKMPDGTWRTFGVAAAPAATRPSTRSSRRTSSGSKRRPASTSRPATTRRRLAGRAPAATSSPPIPAA